MYVHSESCFISLWTLAIKVCSMHTYIHTYIIMYVHTQLLLQGVDGDPGLSGAPGESGTPGSRGVPGKDVRKKALPVVTIRSSQIVCTYCTIVIPYDFVLYRGNLEWMVWMVLMAMMESLENQEVKECQ